jgi:hypothetical protein
MTTYRLLFRREGRFCDRVDLEFDDDSAAIALISKHDTNLDMELWEEARLVSRFPCKHPIRESDPAAPYGPSYPKC